MPKSTKIQPTILTNVSTDPSAWGRTTLPIVITGPADDILRVPAQRLMGEFVANVEAATNGRPIPHPPRDEEGYWLAEARKEGVAEGLRHAATLVRDHDCGDDCDACLDSLAEKLERLAKEGEK